MGSEMDTFTARLASFDVVLKPEKRRSSGVKGPRFVAWPHSKPSPAELAHAGFFYKPYESNPDNTTCFECGRALDGWEEDDNPITEHLKHSPDCGWAITMDIHQGSSNPSSIEDPTSDRISQARLATFGSAWPHDGKRGWTCQSEKMVEAGWYFCPTEEETDLASCAYCKLSLDGWEPKDDPYEEHYRRSPHCSFFVYAQAPTKKGKGTKGKKTRVSKTSSRLSTQSVDTVASEVPEVDMDESMDQSIMSQTASKPKGAKRGPKGKGKSTKSKTEDMEMESQMEPENVEPEQPAAPKPKRGRKKKVVEEVKQNEPKDVDMEDQAEMDTAKAEEPEPAKPKRGRKKRVSEEITQDDPEPVTSARNERASIKPPSKRRNTQTRTSGLSQTYDHEVQDAPFEDEVPQDEKPKRGRKPKKGTSQNRKISDVSVSSKSTSKARVPRDSELDTTIKAGLEEDEPEQVEREPSAALEPEPEPESEPEPQPVRVSKKGKTSKKAKAAAKSAEQPLQEPEAELEDERSQVVAEPEVDAMEVTEEPVEEPAPKPKAAKGSKKKATKKSKKEESKSKTEHEAGEENNESSMSLDANAREAEPMHASEPEPESQLPEHEEETPEKPVTKKSSKKADKTKKSKKSKKEPTPEPEPVQEEPTIEEPAAEDPIEDVAMEDEPVTQHTEPMSPSVDEEYGTPEDLPDEVEMVAPQESSPPPRPSTERTPVPPKTTKRFSDIPPEEHLTESITKSHSSRGSDTQRTPRSSNRPVSPLPPPHQSTPSMSPQSSDAENRPPSSRPSTSRPALASASKEPQARTPLAAATPSPTKRNFNGGFAASSHPWTPVDIDEALFGEPSDKENADLSSLFNGMKRGLTSPEKKMTVQEWIMWNAKNGEERLKRECERLVSQFEKEGGRAMQRLEAIECID